MNIEKNDFYISGAELRIDKRGAALRFVINVSEALYEKLGGRENITEYGTLVLPLELTHGKDMFYGEPIYSNEGYSIRGYGNIHRKTGEYTYNNSAILGYPVAVQAKSFIAENTYTACVTDIPREHYCRFYCAQGYVKYIRHGSEKIIYSNHYQASLYGAALEAARDNPDNGVINEIINYCEVERKRLYLNEQFTGKELPVFTAQNIKNLKIERIKNQLICAEYTIDWYGGSYEPTEIVQLTDPHLNYINQRDIIENNSAVMSTAEHRIWCCNGATAAVTLRAMEYASFADKIVLTGDVLDYNSHGCLQLAERLMFKNTVNVSKHYGSFSRVTATLGNHEPTKQMEGKVADTNTADENILRLSKCWPNDVSYHSETVVSKAGHNPVKIVLLDNHSGRYRDAAIPEKLAADINEARQKNMPVLIFQHIPLYMGFTAVLRGLLNPMLRLNSARFCGFPECADELTLQVCRLITDNADVIRGVFCGHHHEYFYTDISGTGPSSGTDIPQHIFQSLAYGKGCALKIMIK